MESKMDYNKTCARIDRKNKLKNKNNFFGSQKHIRIKTNIIEKQMKKNLYKINL